jgi:hypothetical protein
LNFILGFSSIKSSDICLNKNIISHQLREVKIIRKDNLILLKGGEKRNMEKKKFLIPLFVILAIGIIAATVYVVNSLTLTVGVAEPFTVEYAVLGDGGTYHEGIDLCTSPNTKWFTSPSESVPTGDIIAGESRFVCVKITNKAEASIPYIISTTVTDADGNIYTNPTAIACYNAFWKAPIAGTVDAKTSGGENVVKIDGALVQVDSGAAPVGNCIVKIDVARGSA